MNEEAAQQLADDKKLVDMVQNFATLAEQKVRLLKFSIELAESQRQDTDELEKRLSDARFCAVACGAAADTLRRAAATERRMIKMLTGWPVPEPRPSLRLVGDGDGPAAA